MTRHAETPLPRVPDGPRARPAALGANDSPDVPATRPPVARVAARPNRTGEEVMKHDEWAILALAALLAVLLLAVVVAL